MSTHKSFDKICCVVLSLTLILTVVFVNAERLGIQKASTVMGYENTLFDKSKVHTIDIIIDDWDEFTENCRSEEYYDCSVVIDNDAYKNVAIRGKGNTSLSSVTNGRYSYKIEFDHYDSTNTYHGLDKLCLNNVIQDNTYMKDYLTYTMMNDMGVAAPLCSFAYITVNGEDWGLYLAVEGVEESFLQRNYGKDYGELYKPDSLNMGGGRGNGKDFDMDDFVGREKSDSAEITAVTEAVETTENTNTTTTTTTAPESTSPSVPEMPEGMTPPDGGSMPEGFTFPEGMTPPDFGGEMPEGMTPPDFGGMTPPDFGGQAPSDMGGRQMPMGVSTENSSSPQVMQMRNNSSFAPPSDFDMSSVGGMGNFDFDIDEETVRNAFRKLGIDESLLDGIDFENISMTDIMSLMSELDDDTVQKLMQEIMGESFSGMPSFDGNMPSGFGGLGMGSSDVKLQYIDDDLDSYSNIFENAKTDVTKADKKRLIEALKKLSSGEDISDTVDVEAVIRYFVVHNFVVNSDSYTGSMIHNYYLYEKDGQMQMIPWDYNLAFGSFMSMGSATSSVNDPIDTPLSVNGAGDRPMIDWILSNEEYTALYHSCFNEFIEEYFDSGYFSQMIDDVREMISPYVEKDPTKFCTFEEFETGISTLKEFCELRAESVKGQLNGTIGSTSDTQKTETLVDAGELNISSMGTMGGMGGRMSRPDEKSENQQENFDKPSNDEEGNNSRPQMPAGFGEGAMPDFGNWEGEAKEDSDSS